MKGFFSFAIILAMILMLFSLSTATLNQAQQIEETKNELIKAEIANKDRTLLENNTDKIIYSILEKEINKKNFNVKLVQNEINSELEKYFAKKATLTNLTHEEKGKANKDKLNENTSLVILRAEESTYSEYVYTSAPLKDIIVSAKLGNEIITYFQIPVGYTTRIIKFN